MSGWLKINWELIIVNYSAPGNNSNQFKKKDDAVAGSEELQLGVNRSGNLRVFDFYSN